jgi:hypothetical protein
MSSGIIIAVVIGCCFLIILGTVLGVYFSNAACPDFGYECTSETSPSPSTPVTTGPAGVITCTGRSVLNASRTACDQCSLPAGKGFASSSGCETINCPSGEYGGYSFVGCTRCRLDDVAVPPGYILQGGSDDCAIIRCQSGTSVDATKTTCVPNPPPPPPPAGCTGYWNNGTQCNMPRSCGQRGYYIDSYVVPTGSAACNIANGSTRDTRLCDNWSGAPAGGVWPCI